MTELESSRIPYQASSLHGEKVLVLAPHPDDEVIGCGGVIALLRDARRLVNVVIVTDGTAADQSQSSPGYLDLRESESRAGLQLLGADPPRFLRMQDRSLSQSLPALVDAIRALLVELSPDLILVPSPVEIHPDHEALARAFLELIEVDEAIATQLPLSNVAFYEVSQPMRPNTLVDITGVAERKYRAIAAHESQTRQKDYETFARGLNQYRALTLGADVRFAEAFWVTSIQSLRVTAWPKLRQEVAGTAVAEIISEIVPITVIVRTRNRPAMLREALQSIRANDYPAHIVVVNDGGVPVGELTAALGTTTLLERTETVGRSEAMNRGVAAATTPFLAFLDDDDLYYPNHLATLARAASGGVFPACYTDAISTFHSIGHDGSYTRTSSHRNYGQDYDPLALRFDNYIPLPTLLVSREDYLDVGGFDRNFDMFEDWDFLLRLSTKGSFKRIPRVTCEIRHFAGSDSIMLANPEGSAVFREAKLSIWKRHGIGESPSETLSAFEHLKRVRQRVDRERNEANGRRHHVELDVSRLEGDKSLLIDQITNLHAALQREIFLRESAVTALQSESASAQQRIEGLEGSVKSGLAGIEAAQREADALRTILETIYRSRTWKVHELVERIKGVTK